MDARVGEVGQADVDAQADSSHLSSEAGASDSGPVPDGAGADALAPSPTLTGEAREGQVLSITPAVGWAPPKGTSVAYSWLRCSATGDARTLISDSSPTSTSQRLLSAEDVGTRVQGRMQLGVGASASIFDTAPSDVVLPVLPVNVTLPQIQGTPSVGSLLTASAGEWTSKATLAYAFQWLRCNSAGSGCAEIPGATSDRYTVRTIDARSTLRTAVTASASSGASASVRSAATSAVSAPTCTNPTQTIGPRSPTVAVSRSATVSWTNPSWATIKDGKFAETQSMMPGDVSDTLTVSGFGLNLPLTASIRGIVVTVTRSSRVGMQISDHLIELRTSSLRNSTTRWGARPEEVTYGSPNDSLDLTPADINGDELTFRLSVRHSGTSTESDAARVDAVRLTVYYDDASSTGAKHPASIVDDASVGTVAWQNPGAASTEAKGAAQLALNAGKASHRLLATGFGLELPAGKAPTGVLLHISLVTSGIGPMDTTMSLMKNGAKLGEERNPPCFNNVGGSCVFGGADDPWGATLTAADVADATFGFGLRVNLPNAGAGATLSVDDIAIEVLYDPIKKQADLLPSTVTSIPSSKQWSDSGNATAIDNRYAGAIISGTDFTEDLMLTGFGFDIPSNAIVTGISLRYVAGGRNFHMSDLADKRVQLTIGGVPVCANKASSTSWTSSPYRASYGSSTDTWGCAWDGATVDATDFGVLIAARYTATAGNDEASIDGAELTLIYCLP